MTRNRILAVALAAAFAAGTSATAVAAGDKQQSASGTTPMAKNEPFSKLDTDKDGYVGRIEAAADADAKSRFETLDANKDGKLSRSEYEASGAMGAASRTPASGSKK